MRIEAIPNFATGIYALIAKKSPCIRDLHQQIAEEVSAKAGSGRILDVGTGPGYLPLAIAKRASGPEIFGIDLSSGMVDIANKNAKEAGLSGRVKFQVANASSLPFADGYFDFVISSLSLHHWLNPCACFKEIHRVLKNNGEAYIYDIRKDTAQETDAQIRRQYGWFLSFLFLKVVRLHSSLSFKSAENLLSSLEANFSQKRVEESGVLLRLKLVK